MNRKIILCFAISIIIAFLSSCDGVTLTVEEQESTQRIDQELITDEPNKPNEPTNEIPQNTDEIPPPEPEDTEPPEPWESAGNAPYLVGFWHSATDFSMGLQRYYFFHEDGFFDYRGDSGDTNLS